MKKGNILIDVLISLSILSVITILVINIVRVEFKNKSNLYAYYSENEEKIYNTYIDCRCSENEQE